MTPHIKAEQGEIAKVVIMPGDPLRAKYIAEKFLTNPKLVNSVRNMLMFTGEYQGQPVTVAGSGMGFGSMGIYSYELFKFYDVDTIIRIGTAGSTDPEIVLNDVIIVDHAVGDTDYQLRINGIDSRSVKPSPKVVEALVQTANEFGDKIKTVGVRSTENFYRKDDNVLELAKQAKTSAEEMEAYALFANALATGKQAGALITISDELITHKKLTPEERQSNVDKMALLSLETIAKLI